MTENSSDPCAKSVSPPKLAIQPKTGNENNITISLGDRGCCNQSPQPAPSSTAIALQPNPIALNVSTETDWPTIAVGLSSAVIAVIIAYLSHKTQKNQVKANIASIRAKWLEDLREAAAKFIENTSIIINNSHDNKTWLDLDESTSIFSNLVYTQTKISLMLDKSKNENKEIVRTSEEIIKALKGLRDGVSESHVGELANSFEIQISAALEKAWSDIKSDLNPTLLPKLRSRSKI